MDRISISASDYVVLDVETNGLKSHNDDLLSFSLYRPDDGKVFNRFLPLELQRTVKTTQYNGIRSEDLQGEKHLTQYEFNRIIEEFDLKNRIILYYAGRRFDPDFIKNYLGRRHIKGFADLSFYSFKRQLISSRFSDGNITKDNLCKAFGISVVNKVHSSITDCYLEWELFQKMGGQYYLITGGDGYDNIFRLTSDYIIPVSLLYSHPNIKYLLSERPFISCKTEELYSLTIQAKGLRKFETNFNGLIIENLLDSMLHVCKIESADFLIQNKSKLEWIGQIPSKHETVLLDFKEDGLVEAVYKKDKTKEKELNSVITILKKELEPLVRYIRDEIFRKKPIRAQELIVNKEYNILALCDLSSDEAVLEIKTDNLDSEHYKEQLYYQTNGRRCYHLRTEWERDYSTNTVKGIVFRIFEVFLKIDTPPSENWALGKRAIQREKTIVELGKRVQEYGIKLVNYSGTREPVKLKCLKCENEWETSYYKILHNHARCPYCQVP